MEAKDKSLNDIFNGSRKFVVPFFQRHYVWQRPQWERFLEDMEYMSQEDKDYFLGSVIFKQQLTTTSIVGDVRTIIDGQQRLTTLAIFFKALCLKTHNELFFDRVFRIMVPDAGNYRFENAISHSLLDQAAFSMVLSNTTDAPLSGKSKIIEAYNFFQETIDISRIDLPKLQKHMQFVVIDLQPTENEQLIFDTINTLGLRLTTAELLKNYLFDNSSMNLYNSVWRPVFEPDDETISFWNDKVTKGRMKKNTIETFFYYFLQIKIQDPSLGLSAAERKERYRRWDNLFENYKSLVEEKGMTKAELAKEISEYGQIFLDNFDPSIGNSIVSQNPSIERINLLIWEMDCTTLMPFMMQILHDVSDESERASIFEYIESYIMRRAISGSVNKEYNDLFGEQLIGSEYCTKEGVKDYLENRGSDALLAIPSDSRVLAGTNNQKWSNDKARVVLYMLESKMLSDKSLTMVRSFDSYALEHLMPQNWKKNWALPESISEEERIESVFSLGNLSLITSTLNSSISNAQWDIKLNGRTNKPGLAHYAQGLETLAGVLTSDIWDESHIVERSVWLGKQAIKYWSI